MQKVTLIDPNDLTNYDPKEVEAIFPVLEHSNLV